MQIGRPALRRQISPEDHDAASAEPDSPQGDAAVTRIDDVRIVELGMAVHRAQVSSAVATAATADMAMKLDGVQAAIDDVRESLSPRSPHVDDNSTKRVVDTRIRASASIDDQV